MFDFIEVRLLDEPGAVPCATLDELFVSRTPR